jgi:hypothetical protein
MIVIEISPPVTQIDPPVKDKVNVVCQFFIHPNSFRQKELEFCLAQLVKNPHIDNIYLLNERIYTDAELGITSDKITQKVIGKRLSYKDFLDFVDEITGYCILINSDIFFDHTITNLFKSDLSVCKSSFCQLRFEYTGNLDVSGSKIFGPRPDSQDTWIIHSNFNVEKKHRQAFNFNLGKPGCDNKITYLFRILGYKCYNCPLFIKTYHFHCSQVRNYDSKDLIKNPYVYIYPEGVHAIEATRLYDFSDNDRLYNYLQEKIQKKEHFVIPRMSSVENNCAVFARLFKQGQIPLQMLDMNFQYAKPVMKNNAGIKMSDLNSLIKYSDMYLSAFDKCELYGDWEPHGDYYKCIDQSHPILATWCTGKQPIWSYSFDVFHFIYSRPWTTALRGQRILLITPFIESISEKLSTREKIYDGVDLFPECSFVFLKPPQTHANNDSREFDIELEEFLQELEKIKDTFDVAFVSAGGYGNLICSAIYDMGRSAIYGGGTLQIFFGVLGSRWLKERPDVLKFFMNKYWSRPKESEKPKDCKNIEGGCYW